MKGKAIKHFVPFMALIVFYIESCSTAVTQTIRPASTTIPTSFELGVGSMVRSEKDGMTLVYVPAGEFTMGSEDDNNDDEKPVHEVNLDAFWIDQTEVTNFMYAKCVADSKCRPPSSTKSYTRDSYYGNSEFDNFP